MRWNGTTGRTGMTSFCIGESRDGLMFPMTSGVLSMVARCDIDMFLWLEIVRRSWWEAISSRWMRPVAMASWLEKRACEGDGEDRYRLVELETRGIYDDIVGACASDGFDCLTSVFIVSLSAKADLVYYMRWIITMIYLVLKRSKFLAGNQLFSRKQLFPSYMLHCSGIRLGADIWTR
ncbi:hypothetical protein AZE42_11159, partial [Rhizopogon vesiculosus]